MQLEKIGFARQRWNDLRVDHASDFSTIAAALDHALLDDVPVRLFNFPLCTVPEAYRALAVPSISDWKRKYVPPCDGRSEEHTSELPSLMRISYAVFCLKKTKAHNN